MVTFTTPSSEVQAMVEKSPDEIEKKDSRNGKQSSSK
jgi:hypothetical protein